MTFARRTRVGAAFVVLSLAGLLTCLAACGGGGGPVILNGASVTIQLTPTLPGSASALAPGDSASIEATVFDPNNKGVTWTLSPPSFGSLTNPTSTSVTYTAPATIPAAATATILATSITNPNVIASVQIPTSSITILLAAPGDGSIPLTPLPDQTISQGGTLNVEALIANNSNLPVMTWTLVPASGSGTLTAFDGGPLVNTTAALVTYAAPATVSSPTTVAVTATTAAGVAATVRITVLPSGGGPNVAVITVNGGPIPGQVYKNGAFINGVTICNPGQPPPGAFSFPVCQTVNGILVDTGSYGLRILQTAIPSLKLPGLVNTDGSVLQNCAAFPDGSYLWGPVETADVYVAGMFASSFVNGASAAAPIQVISNRLNGAGVPDSCSNGGVNLNTPELLGANGILGVGPEPNDCTVAGVNFCDGSAQPVPPNVYYACPATGCAPADSPVFATKLQQVGNLARLFSKNGVVITLPPVSGAESAVNGTLTFGFPTPGGTVPGATIHTLDSNDNFTTLFNGQSLTRSFIASGSNAFFFPDSLPACDVNTQFFCPLALTNLSATNQGATEGETVIDFAVDNADNLFATHPGFAAFGTLAGPKGTGTCSAGSGACSFEWGLPFFYGRTVYTKMDACSPLNPCTPLLAGWWAY